MVIFFIIIVINYIDNISCINEEFLIGKLSIIICGKCTDNNNNA